MRRASDPLHTDRVGPFSQRQHTLGNPLAVVGTEPAGRRSRGLIGQFDTVHGQLHRTIATGRVIQFKNEVSGSRDVDIPLRDVRVAPADVENERRTLAPRSSIVVLSLDNQCAFRWCTLTFERGSKLALFLVFVAADSRDVGSEIGPQRSRILQVDSMNDQCRRFTRRNCHRFDGDRLRNLGGGERRQQGKKQEEWLRHYDSIAKVAVARSTANRRRL